MADEYDSPWKEVLDLYFRQFLGFFFPDIEADVDWSRGYESVDKELPQLERDAETGRRYADKLMKVWRKNGEERLVFIHIEVQGTPDPGFPERMYVYNYRIFDRQRFRWKRYLIRRLYERGYERRDVIALFRFIDWLMVLPPEYDEKTGDEVDQLEAERKMRYVTSIERRAIAKGLVQGQLSLLKRQLTRRFQQLPAWVDERLGQASSEELESWADRVLDAESLDEVFAAG